MAAILLIDNDPALIDQLVPHLTASGHQVFPARDGLAGLKLIHSHSFDLVITEVFMPEADGLEVIANLKMKEVCPKVIVMFRALPCFDPKTLPAAARLLGADRVLLKPFGAEELLTSLRELVARELGTTSGEGN